jgi:hypothetical protein
VDWLKFLKAKGKRQIAKGKRAALSFFLYPSVFTMAFRNLTIDGFASE